MGFNYKMARQHIDKKIKEIGSLESFIRPPKGWIRAIRDALGMTTTQLAKRMGVTQSRIIAIEKDELAGNLKLDTLARVADALDCQLIYTLVPRQKLEALVYAQAEKKAKMMLKHAEHSMSLENQSSSKEDYANQIAALIQELLKGSQSKLWDED